MTTSRTRTRSVCVFCGSSCMCDARYLEAAAELGTVLAGKGYTTVYGGGRVGSMGYLADAALAAGGLVIGYIPAFMIGLEWQHLGLSDLVVVEDMAERKDRMIRAADAVVALPGGSGTLEELTETLTRKRLGQYLGPIVLVNTGGFFDPFVQQLDACVEARFMHRRHRDMWQVVEKAADVIEAFGSAVPWTAGDRRFAAL